ncbi:MAG: PAS domain S-box protein [Deltaproteobacteria bacterium]|nr:PAS domain S-box protein [Deltaproteobacteria bacterium]
MATGESVGDKQLEAEIGLLRDRVRELEAALAEQSSANARLRQSECAYLTTLRAAPIGIGHVCNRILGWSNERLQQMLGYTAEELFGKSARMLYESDEEYARVGAIKHPLVRTHGVGAVDTRFVRKDGRVLEVLLSSAAIDPDDWIKGLVFTVNDQTEQRQAERVRDRLFDVSVDLLAVAGFDGYFKEVNPAWTRALGWSEQELLSRPWVEFVHPEDREGTENAREHLVNGYPVFSFQNRYLHKDGSWRHLSWNSAPIQEDSLIFAVARDVTDERKAAAEAQRLERRWQSVVDQSPFGMHLYELGDDDELVFVGANAAADRILGVPFKEFVGKTLEEAFPQLQATEIPRRYREAARDGTPWSSMQVDYVRGTLQRAFEVHAFQCSPGSMVAAFVDIGERMRAEDTIRRTNEDLKLLIDTAMEFVRFPPGEDVHKFLAQRLEGILPDAVVAVTAYDEVTGNVTTKALKGLGGQLDAVIKILGFDPGRTTTRPTPELLALMATGRLSPFPGGIYELCCGVIPKALCPAIEALFQFEEILVMGLTRGERIFGNVTILSRKGKEPRNRSVLEAFLRQASVALERAHAEDALRASEEQLRHSQRLEAIGTLAGGIAHDFNNQLTAILAFSNQLRADSEPGSHVYESAAVIETAAMRSAELTRQLLGFARKGKMAEAPVDARVLSREVAAVLRRTVDKRIAITEVCCDEQAVVLGDINQLQQVVLNLGVNACDAMPDGGKLTFRTEVLDIPLEAPRTDNGLPAGRHVVLSVSDTGVGIPEEHRHRIFEPFFTTKAQGKGTGMGLALAYGVVRSHRGTIRVQSEVGAGTTFQILLPRVSARVREDETVASAPVHGKGRVLVVDDEELIRTLAVRSLERLGYNVDACPDGKSAIEFFTEHHRGIDLVILDMVMPGMNGNDCLARMRQVDPNVRALLSSGHGLDDSMRALVHEGAVGFVQKPYVLAQLSSAVADAIAKKQGD